MKYIKSLLLVLSFVVLGCKDQKTGTIVTGEALEDSEFIHLSKAQFKIAKMEFGKLEEKPFAQTIHTKGAIDVPPQNKAVISAFSGGYIKELPLMVGDKVHQGQLLVRLENPEFIGMQQQYLEIKEQLSYLKSEYERQQIMLEEKITSQKSFLKAESDYKSNLARYNSLRKNLEMLNINPASVEAGNIVSEVNIYSPITGVVTMVNVNRGSYVSSVDKIMEVMNPNHILLELKVFEKDLFALEKGQEILFKVPEASKEIFRGKIQLVGASIDPISRMAMVLGQIDSSQDQNFTAGMFVEADIVTATSNQMALPETAVVEFEDQLYVLVVEEENEDGFVLSSVEVEVGDSFQGFVSIQNVSDFKPNVKILTKGGFALLQESDDDLHH